MKNGQTKLFFRSMPPHFGAGLPIQSKGGDHLE
jgi:hypothetical protein